MNNHVSKIDIRSISNPDLCPFIHIKNVRCARSYRNKKMDKDQYICECIPDACAPQSGGKKK